MVVCVLILLTVVFCLLTQDLSTFASSLMAGETDRSDKDEMRKVKYTTVSFNVWIIFPRSPYSIMWILILIQFSQHKLSNAFPVVSASITCCAKKGKEAGYKCWAENQIWRTSRNITNHKTAENKHTRKQRKHGRIYTD